MEGRGGGGGGEVEEDWSEGEGWKGKVSGREGGRGRSSIEWQ